jgi:hypothetical protein
MGLIMAKRKKLDKWDFILLALFAGYLYVLYMSPTWTDPDQNLQFIINVVDKTIGYLFAGIIIKKVIQKSDK